jgi:hypothetical protein
VLTDTAIGPRLLLALGEQVGEILPGSMKDALLESVPGDSLSIQRENLGKVVYLMAIAGSMVVGIAAAVGAGVFAFVALSARPRSQKGRRMATMALGVLIVSFVVPTATLLVSRALRPDLPRGPLPRPPVFELPAPGETVPPVPLPTIDSRIRP